MTLNYAVGILKAINEIIKGNQRVCFDEQDIEAIDTVVAELESRNHKELTCFHNWKEWEDENCNAQLRCTKCKSIRKWNE